MFNVDENTGRIDMHRGDTGGFTITLTGYTLGENDRVLITFRSANGTEIKKAYYKPENNQVTVLFRNPETDYLAAGDYQWDVRVIIDPVYDENGNVVEGTGTESISSSEITDGESVSTPRDAMTLHIRSTVGQI